MEKPLEPIFRPADKTLLEEEEIPGANPMAMADVLIVFRYALYRGSG